MSVALLWVVSPNSQLSRYVGFADSVRDGNRLIESSRFLYRDRSSMFSCRQNKDRKQKWNSCSFDTDFRHPCLGGINLPEISMVASTAGEIAVSSEEKVYNVVLKQAALVNRQLRSSGELDVKPDIVLPGTLSLLSEAYDRCGEVCAEYAKTFYLG